MARRSDRRSHKDAAPRMSRRRLFTMAGAGLTGAALLPLTTVTVGRAQETTLTGISHRQPSLEYYAKALDRAIPGVHVNMTLMPVDKAFEVETLNLSSGSDTYDIIWVNDSQVKLYAKNGWLEPLDALWLKYKQQMGLGDYPASVLDSLRYDGKLYAVPLTTLTMVFFYRADLFKEKGFQPPKTFDGWLADARQFNSPKLAGTVMSLKAVDALINETHYYLNAYADGWFDKKWKPVFNNARGVAAIDHMKALYAYALPGATSIANDEATVAFQQGLGAMGLQWISRAATMDDPTKSKVVDKMEWSVPPRGGQRIVVDSYAISKFSKKNKDTIFRVLTTATGTGNQREAADLGLPSRASVLNDVELQKKYRYYPAALDCLKVGKPYPSLPEFQQVAAAVAPSIQQAITGGTPTKQALDTAADAAEKLLAARGYYK